MSRSPKTEQNQAPVITISDGTLIPQKGDNAVLSAWNLAFFGALVILAALCLFKPDPYQNILSFVPVRFNCITCCVASANYNINT